MCSLGSDEQLSGHAPEATTNRDDTMLISVRAAVVLLAALFVAGCAGILTFATSHDLARSSLAAGGAFLAATVFCNNTVISRRG
ncbi:hypothetical protein J4573_07095 [Actinomadura barringtoniae]|uniref:Uncharacterized protein n=1 Tax=Actinomadura barringtoniae TaxID=1427535 RepID=A0A939P7W0_9ACTN|nr:hypothetical protein [Actinomadura barringtoniae]MBO2446852.1 hypothetical protein [Actinomadura barringtoniae]